MNQMQTSPGANWAGNIHYSAQNLVEPASIAELQELVRSAKPGTLKALGTRHTFNRIADTEGTIVSLRRFDGYRIDKSGGTATIGTGVRYGDLAPKLHADGSGLLNMASLPHIGVAGAIATGTHGSGDRSGVLASAVIGIEFVDGRGEIVQVSCLDGSDFPGHVVHLGALGVVTELTLSVPLTYSMQQYVFEHLPARRVFEDLDRITGAAHSVSLFTDWQNASFSSVWLKDLTRRSGPPEEFFGARRSNTDRHPVPGLDGGNTTPQCGVIRPWYEILPHFRLEFTPSVGQELHTEYFVAREHAVPALKKLFEMGDRIAPHLLISEVRTVAGDDLWMSPAYHRDSVTLHFTWKPNPEPVQGLMQEIELALSDFAPRPHWGKLFAMDHTQIRTLYPKYGAFCELVRRHDPQGKFRNNFLRSSVFGE